MVDLNDVTVSYGGQTVIENCSLRVLPGEHIAVMGSSGSGKTTLLKLIAGTIAPTSGTVHVSTEKISYMFQEPRLLPWLNAEDNVNLVLSDNEKTMDTARHWLEIVELSGAMKKRPGELSGGMRQRVALARAMAYGGDLFLLDEPMSALDTALSAHLLSILHQYTQDKTMIFVTHCLEQAKQISNKIYVIKNKALELM